MSWGNLLKRGEVQVWEIHLWGILSALLYYYIVLRPPLSETIVSILLAFLLLAVFYSRASFLLASKDDTFSLVCMLAWAVIFRLIFLFVPDAGQSTFSSDLYRYLWEGEVFRSGHNPFLLAPDSEVLLNIRQAIPEIWSAVDHKTIPAIYPPGAQLIFSLIPADVLSLRLFCLSGDLLLQYLLLIGLKRAGFPRGRLVLYSWLPLVVLELIRSAHLEAFAVPVMLCALLSYTYRRSNTCLWASMFCIATSIKYVALIPFGYCVVTYLRSERRLGALLPIVFSSLSIFVLLVYPFSDAGFQIFSALQTYAEHWRFNGLCFRLLELFYGSLALASPAFAAKLTSLLICIAAFIACVIKNEGAISASARLILIALLLAPVLYPWYLLWFVPLFVLSRNSFLGIYTFFLSHFILLSYEVLRHPEVWELSWLILAIEYLSPVLLGVLLMRSSMLVVNVRKTA
jgi:hypothetical protein